MGRALPADLSTVAAEGRPTLPQMAATITEISINGYKSIGSLDRLPMRSLNVLVGANGAGKSNFVGVLVLLQASAQRRLQRLVQVQGGADALLHLGPRMTEHISITLSFGEHGYGLELTPTAGADLIVSDERVTHSSHGNFDNVHFARSSGVESVLRDEAPYSGFRDQPGNVAVNGAFAALSELTAYHFDDTSPTAGVRRWGGVNDDERLRPDASNLAAFLHRIRVTHPDHLTQIRDVVRLAAPFFDDFKLRPILTHPDQIQLEWTQAGTDYPFRPSQLSDGTLRFICLATALLQPEPPAVMMFDEPELGLHPYALTLLAALFRQAAAGPSQIIVSTQSATLLNEFDAEDVIIVERANGASTFRRLEPAALTEWLAEYGLGELWQKNVFGGRPTPEVGGRL